jgi:hypothetical protein
MPSHLAFSSSTINAGPIHLQRPAALCDRRRQSLREQKKTLSEIGAELTVRGYTPQRGGRWYPAQIKAILDMTPQPGRGTRAA